MSLRYWFTPREELIDDLAQNEALNCYEVNPQLNICDIEEACKKYIDKHMSKEEIIKELERRDRLV